MNRLLTRLALLLFIGFSSAPARADVPPPGPDETCTIDKQRRSAEECLACSAWHGDEAKCQKRLGKRGYERRCRGAGTSVWWEVWCRPIGKGASPKP